MTVSILNYLQLYEWFFYVQPSHSEIHTRIFSLLLLLKDSSNSYHAWTFIVPVCDSDVVFQYRK